MVHVVSRIWCYDVPLAFVEQSGPESAAFDVLPAPS